jgi:integrase
MSDTPKPKGGRAPTGTVLETRDGRLQAQVTFADGSRKRLKPFPRGTSRELARERTAHHAAIAATIMPERAAAPEATPEIPDSPMGRWFTAWVKDREARGLLSKRENTAHYLLHIAPSIGPKHVRDWTKEDLRKLCRDLDAKVQGKTIAWKTAINVWATATKIAGDSCESKNDELRCRTDNPADGVRGPDRGDEVGEQCLYPSEFLKFAQCEAVPLRWRRVVALAVYLYPRDAEIRALQCRDADTEHSSLRITKAIDRRTGEVKATKGRRNRNVTIEPAIAPLLEVIKRELGDDGALVPDMPSERDMARGLRRWLKRAGVDRHELHDRTPTTRPIRFHDLRATGITWMAVRGDDPLKIQHRAGHTDFETTQRYIRMAEALREGFGTPFPTLPPALVSHAAIARASLTQRNQKQILRGGRDSNPRPPA